MDSTIVRFAQRLKSTGQDKMAALQEAALQCLSNAEKTPNSNLKLHWALRCIELYEAAHARIRSHRGRKSAAHLAVVESKLPSESS